MNIALCAIAKNENLYIQEWVKYYKDLGISKIFLYDNNDVNGECFEDVLNNYIEDKFVVIENYRGKIRTNDSNSDDGLSIQGQAYKDCIDKHWNEFDWICFFDIDEFLSIDSKYKDLDDFFKDFKDYDGVKVQWRCYGDDNQIFYEDKPVIKRFKKDNNYSYSNRIKTILKCQNYLNKNLKFSAHGPFNKDLNIVNVLKKRLDKNPYIDTTNNNLPYVDLPVYLDHFYSKSCDEFFRRKYMQTSAVFGAKKGRNYDINFLIKQYFETNQKTKEKIDYINYFKDNYKSVNVYISSIYDESTIDNDIDFVNNITKTLESVINEPEVNKLYLTVYNYTDSIISVIKKIINSKKLNVLPCDGKKRQNEKFKYVWCTTDSKYVAFCNDNLIYPRNYFYDMIHECNDVKSPISCCGWKIKKNPIINYADSFDPYLFNININNNKLVDIVGCNSLLLERNCFTQNGWRSLYDKSPDISMDSILISDLLHKKGYSLFVKKHDYNYVFENHDYEFNEDFNYEFKKNYINKNFFGKDDVDVKENQKDTVVKETVKDVIKNKVKDIGDVDYVITYVDNNEISWVKSYINECLKINKQIFLKSARFRTPNTLKYHLRAVEKYMPWIRNVYIIVSDEKQVPKWINKDNVKIVYHKDYIPKEYLPTFNSNTIELFMWKIKDLSENFIYANDDIYPNSELSKSDFFDNQGNIKVNLGYLNLNTTNEVFSTMLRNTQNMVFDDLGMDYEERVLKSDHTLKPMKKSLFEYFFKKRPKKMYDSLSTFRNKKNITLEICNFYYYLKNEYSLKSTNDVYKEYKANNVEEVCDCIKDKSIHTLCINDVTSFKGDYKKYNKKMIEAFEETLPEKSKYEL